MILLKDQEKSRLEKQVEQGLYGKPELKKEEKNRFLGEFKERVIRYLKRQQVEEPGVYPQVLVAIQDSRAKKLILDRQIDETRARDYIALARENDLDFKRVSSPDFEGEVGLVVVSDQAVDVKKRQVMNRKENLQNLGIDDRIIKNVGAKLCKQCWQELEDKAPEELINYNKMSFVDKITGTSCVCKQ